MMKFDIDDDNRNKNGVYMIECINGMQYIGSVYRMSKSDLPRAGFYGRYYQYCSHRVYNKKIQSCINKYGFDSLTMKLIEVVDGSQNDVRNRELFYINYFNTFKTSHGLNLKLSICGGNGGANKGKKYPPRSKEVVERVAKKLRGVKHKPHTQEYKDKSSAMRLGIPSRSALRYRIVIFDEKRNKRVTLNSVDSLKHTDIPISRIQLRKALWSKNKKIADSIIIESAIQGDTTII